MDALESDWRDPFRGPLGPRVPTEVGVPSRYAINDERRPSPALRLGVFGGSGFDRLSAVDAGLETGVPRGGTVPEGRRSEVGGPWRKVGSAVPQRSRAALDADFSTNGRGVGKNRSDSRL